MITTTSYDLHQTETRKIAKILHGHKILVLNDSLSYTHLGKWLLFNQGAMQLKCLEMSIFSLCAL